jgi:putative hydrolase of the HAD superfamily
VTFFEHVIFDLDDTLLDTSGGLIPSATRRAIKHIVCELRPQASASEREALEEELFKRRHAILRTDPRSNPWLQLADGNSELAEEARQIFLRPALNELPPGSIRPTPGGLELLAWAASRACVYLVTSGDLRVQNQKIDALDVRKYFKSIQIVTAKPSPIDGKGPKYLAFSDIQARYPATPSSLFLSIGNRVDTDLGEAKLLDWRTAWIRFGEHSALSPQKSFEIPDFEVATPHDLLAIWRQQYPIAKVGSFST